MANRPGTFKKGDPRINRNGRPRSFAKLRNLAQQLASEKAQTSDGELVIIDGQAQTQITMLLRELMVSNPVAFLQYAYGKPKEEMEVSTSDEMIKKWMAALRQSDNG